MDTSMTDENKRTMTIKIPNTRNVLIAFVIVVVLLNFYSMFTLNNKMDSITARIVEIGNQPAQPSLQPGPQPSPQPQQQPSKMDVSVDDDAAKGSLQAPVIIIEFSDFECSYCKRFYDQTLPLIQRNYIDTGKVRFVYRDFPLGFHANAQKAAEAAECAGEQEKYWEMHDKMFEGQGLDITTLKQYAVYIGLDTDKFNDCLDSGEMASEVQKDMQDGQSYGVTGTPAFFVDGVKLVGAQPYDVFEQAIENALNE